MKILLCTYFLGLFLFGSVQGRIINVPDDQPTIQAAIEFAIGGDTILVQPGTYVGSLRFNGKSVSIRSEGGPEVTIIQGDGEAAVDIGPRGELIGFTITGGRASFGAGMEVHGRGTLIMNNIFDGNMGSAGGYGAGIGGNVASPLIKQNIFINNQCSSSSGVVAFVNNSSPKIVNNVFFGNSSCSAIDVTLPIGNNHQVINNTIIRNQVGIHIDRRVNTIEQIYRNNILADNGVGLEVVLGSEAQNPTWEYNLVFGNGVDYSLITDQTGISGNISADPMFINSNSDFYLRSNSPGIDAGDPNSPLDPDGTQADIGAFYFDISGPVSEDIADISFIEDNMGQVELSALDPEGDALIFSATSDTVGVILTIIDSRLIIIPDDNWNGSTEITVIASDGEFRDGRDFTLIVTPEPEIVHPGDTDNNGIVNALDILPIGVYFNEEGPSRSANSFIWDPQLVNDWEIFDALFADGNGNGVVDEKDVIAIGVNWGNTHTNGSSNFSIDLSDASNIIQHKLGFQKIYNSLS